MNILEHTTDISIHFDQPPHILVVDDEVFNRRLIHRILSHTFHITEAKDGYEALELINRQHFDLVVLDIMMPGIQGIEVLAEIRQHASKSELPVILVTALHENEDIVRGLQSGANDYIPKPIDTEVVLARVTTQIQLKSSYDLQQKAMQELQQANSLKNSLLSIASHDLKSPISGMYMAEQLLRELTDKTDGAIVDVLDTLNATVNNMNRIIVEFLDLATLQNGHMDTLIEPVDIAAVIDTVIRQYHLHSAEKGSTIRVLNSNGFAFADFKRLIQVLGNLVSNALKYSPPHSEITLDVQRENDSYIISVIDQGPGIPASEQHKLFTEFGKLSTRPTGKESSTGLGLWIVKQMAELMNGTVGFECPHDGGSIFWVKLPASS